MNNLLNAAEKWFSELGIKTVARPTCLMVNRDDMANMGVTGQLPETTYDDILIELRKALSSTKVFWGGKDDNYLYLESF